MASTQELIQRAIHYLEETAASRYLRALLVFLIMVMMAVLYDLRDFKNMSAPEAMDAAQLGRHLADGRGYTTLFIRPFSMHLLEKRNVEQYGLPKSGDAHSDYAHIRGPHPDISNPPVYPLWLAGLMKVLPFKFDVPTNRTPWTNRFQPDVLIALSNQVLFGLVVLLAFFWSRRLFDLEVAWTATAVLVGTELLWRFSISGLSTMLLLLIFMGLVWCLTFYEAEASAPHPRFRALLALAAAAGLAVGVGGLTRYSFACLILPVLVYLLICTSTRRVTIGLVAVAAFAVVMLPWIIRTYHLSGAPFGTATYHAVADTELLPRFRLERSFDPDVRVIKWVIWVKLFQNIREILLQLFINPGGGLISGFFAAGLLVGFRNSCARRIRIFLLLCLCLLILVQALTRTELSALSPEVNAENLLVLLLPLVVIYGVSFFFVLLDQVHLPTRQFRYLAMGAFAVLACLPMLFVLWSARVPPLSYPPYHPLLIQQTSSWMKEDELMMSDIPWAVAWYGNRRCVWLTLNATADPNNPASRENFYTLSDDYFKPVNALYLTQRTTDSRFVSDWIRAGDHSWGAFVLDAILKNEVPSNFPLRQMPNSYLPEQIFLSDWRRWR